LRYILTLGSLICAAVISVCLGLLFSALSIWIFWGGMSELERVTPPEVVLGVLCGGIGLDMLILFWWSWRSASNRLYHGVPALLKSSRALWYSGAFNKIEPAPRLCEPPPLKRPRP
jgi:hypothetical protein